MSFQKFSSDPTSVDEAVKLPFEVSDTPIPKEPFGNGKPSVVQFVGGLTLPTIAALSLFAAAWGTDTHWDAKYGVLSALAFFILYPGRWANNRAAINVGKMILTPWARALAILAVLGIVTDQAEHFDRLVLFAWALTTPLVQIAALQLLPGTLARLVAARRPKHRVAIIGASIAGQSFAHSLATDPILHSTVIAYFDDRSSARLGPLSEAPLAGQLKDISHFVRENRVDQFYIALPMSSQPRTAALLQELQDYTASVFFVPDIATIQLVQPRVDIHAGFPVVAVCTSPFEGVNAVVKRTTDLLIACLAIVALLPVMMIIGLMIKLSSPGPVMFKQRRFGLDGSEIIVWKFRSMAVSEDGVGQYTQVTRGDPRVTPLGRVLRKTSLDELPQLFNVLQGRMSIVGPRPHAVRVNEHYRRMIRGYMIRHKVRPGITGWAQVNGFRGGDDLVSMTRRIEHDLAYLRYWSVWLDLRILIRTVSLIVKDTAAY